MFPTTQQLLKMRITPDEGCDFKTKIFNVVSVFMFFFFPDVTEQSLFKLELNYKEVCFAKELKVNKCLKI